MKNDAKWRGWLGTYIFTGANRARDWLGQTKSQRLQCQGPPPTRQSLRRRSKNNCETVDNRCVVAVRRPGTGQDFVWVHHNDECVMWPVVKCVVEQVMSALIHKDILCQTFHTHTGAFFGKKSAANRISKNYRLQARLCHQSRYLKDAKRLQPSLNWKRSIQQCQT